MIQIKTKNKQIKTNKQISKKQIDFFRSTISELNQVRSLRNFQKLFLGVTQDDSNKKQKNKQTNKNFLDGQNLR